MSTNEKPKSIGFRIEGAFITQLAREKFYQENKFSYAVSLLKSCLMNDTLTEWKTMELVYKILNGEAEIKGVYPNDDYGYIETEKNSRYDIERHLASITETVDEQKSRIESLENKLLWLKHMVSDPANLNAQYLEEFDESLWDNTETNENNNYVPLEFSSNPWTDKNRIVSALTSAPSAENMLQSYIQRMRDPHEDDYGWLRPDGTFFPVEWGRHVEWADEYLTKHDPNWDRYSDENLINETAAIDRLISHGWRLLHNPGLGMARLTPENLTALTKKQRDFLLDYYEKRNMKKEYDAIMQSYQNFYDD